MTNEPREAGRREGKRGKRKRRRVLMKKRQRNKSLWFCWLELVCKVSMAYIKLMIEMGWLELAACLNHKTLACSSADSSNNGVSERCLSSQWPSNARLKTQHLHWPAFTRCTFNAMPYKKKFFFKSSVRSSLGKSPKSFKAANPGQNNLWMHNAILKTQTPVLLEMIPYFAFYEDDLRLSPLTGLVISADRGCRG